MWNLLLPHVILHVEPSASTCSLACDFACLRLPHLYSACNLTCDSTQSAANLPEERFNDMCEDDADDNDHDWPRLMMVVVMAAQWS